MSDTVQVELLQDFRHDGKERLTGERIEMGLEMAEIMERLGYVKILDRDSDKMLSNGITKC